MRSCIEDENLVMDAATLCRAHCGSWVRSPGPVLSQLRRLKPNSPYCSIAFVPFFCWGGGHECLQEFPFLPAGNGLVGACGSRGHGKIRCLVVRGAVMAAQQQTQTCVTGIQEPGVLNKTQVVDTWDLDPDIRLCL